jgi:glycine/D-amino acid oxidase-like deaminating enzyme
LSQAPSNARWGNPPWRIDFRGDAGEFPSEVDYAIVGGGFSGLSAAARLRQIAPDRSTALFEGDCVGAGSSGHTGGMALAETAAGDLPGLGDVLKGYQEIQEELGIEADLGLPGAYELGRAKIKKDSPIRWNDSGTMGVVNEVPGGHIDPGKMVSGLAQAAQRLGATIFEHARVDKIEDGNPLKLTVAGKQVLAGHVLIATNAESLELSGITGGWGPKLTLALVTEELEEKVIEQLGLAERKPFYTVDMPYLWGRPLGQRQMIFGCGLVHVEHWSELAKVNVREGEAHRLMASLESRVRQLHPVLANVSFSNHWGGPIYVTDEMLPVFRHHPTSQNITVLGGYSGHGVALSVYLGRWAADAMLGRKKLPKWD